MEKKNWDNLWRDKESLLLWSKPDKDVAGLIPKLKHENVTKVLDLGFGLGRHLVLLAREGFDAYGIEASESGVNHCRKWLETEGLLATISQGDMSTIPYPDGFFDFVLSWNVIYHATFLTMKKTLKEIVRVTCDRGFLYLTLNSTRNNHYGKGFEVEPNTFNNPAKADGEHPHHYSDEKEVRELMKDWRIVSIKEEEETLSDKHFPGSWHWMIFARKNPL
jgi:SAM-dependent methyltransferase